jgi:hypothetical protein
LNNHHVINSKFKRLQKENGNSALVLPKPTRWGSLYGMCFSIHDSEPFLHSLVNEREFLLGSTASQICQREKHKAFNNATSFINLLNRCIYILEPINRKIVLFQNDNLLLSEFYVTFAEFP